MVFTPQGGEWRKEGGGVHEILGLIRGGYR